MKKKVLEGNVFNSPSNSSLGGQFQPIHEIPEWDFLDGALVGVGSLKPSIPSYHTLIQDAKVR
jgi:hypothetical protein